MCSKNETPGCREYRYTFAMSATTGGAVHDRVVSKNLRILAWPEGDSRAGWVGAKYGRIPSLDPWCREGIG